MIRNVKEMNDGFQLSGLKPGPSFFLSFIYFHFVCYQQFTLACISLSLPPSLPPSFFNAAFLARFGFKALTGLLLAA